MDKLTPVDETLSAFVNRLERFQNQYEGVDIIFSDEIEKELLMDGENNAIEKEPILWPLMDKNMFYVVRAEPGCHTKTHSHNEDIFRLLVSGSLHINGREVNVPGTWFVVRAGTTYKIESDGGYTTMAGYGMACQTHSNAGVLTHFVKS